MNTDELQGMMVEALDSLRELALVNAKADDLLKTQIDLVWQSQDSLRDDLHALSNRVEALTRATIREAS